MGGHPLDQSSQIGLDIISLNGEGQTVGHASQLFFFFDQDDLIPLIGQSQGGVHPGHPAADNHGALVDRDDFLLQRLKGSGPRDGHADQFPGLIGRFPGIVRVDPGILVADIGHFQEVFV